MSSSLNSLAPEVLPGLAPAAGGDRIARRRRALCLALAAAPLLLPRAACANTDPTAGLQRWGNGEFRRFGFLVYEATLWAGSNPESPPLALRLDYKRKIPGSAIVEASIKEMRLLGTDETLLGRWGEAMARIMPDVRPGDHILGHYRKSGASFYLNGRLLGAVEDAEFARRFFAIWLDPRGSAPELRAALLRRPAG